jgi:uncharacterized protein YdhG (YjbR/CyaY superfamily)
VAAEDIDGYLASLGEPKRSTLEALRRSILDVVPEAEQCISYGMPAFEVQGKTVGGFAAIACRRRRRLRPTTASRSSSSC